MLQNAKYVKEMFKTSFYNANDVVNFKIISDYLDFLKNIPQEKFPSILIIGLDQNMFQTTRQNLSIYDSEIFNWSHQQFFPDINFPISRASQ